MATLVDGVLENIDSLLSWFSTSIKQTTETYCDLETADDRVTLVSKDGSLVSIIRVRGATALIGGEEFERLHAGITLSLQTGLSREGHAVQVYFNYDKDGIHQELTDVLAPAADTAERLGLALEDLFRERIDHLAHYCSKEEVFFVLWTRPASLTSEQLKRAHKDKIRKAKARKLPPIKGAQNLMAAIPDLRDNHESFVRSTLNDLESLNLLVDLLNVHEACYHIRRSVDPEFTDVAWKPYLPGDKIPTRISKGGQSTLSDLLWPPLYRQLLPREAENLDLRTVRIGDRIYSSVFIDLFPQEIKTFLSLFQRTLPTHIPWRISYLVESNGLAELSLRKTIAAILAFTSEQNRLLSDAADYLRDIDINTDEAVVKLRVSLATWAPDGEIKTLRTRAAQLAKAVQGWGSTSVTEITGDPFGGVVSSMLAVSAESEAPASVAPLSDIVSMLPITRPASTWENGAILFRSPDGKPWPYQPGSRLQTTWIDLIYARPGSGKSVLSNAINLALCLSGGIQRLPFISIVDIGPSSSGLISLLKEALPLDKRHLAAYHRLRMTPDYSINPFDTQLGCRYPTAQERSFLVNFITLLSTPLGADKPYDGIPDMSGLVVDELYKSLSDEGNPSPYTPGIEVPVDQILEEIDFITDTRTTWWEVTDALFSAGFQHEAMLAQRHAMPLLPDVVSICRNKAIEDLYGQIVAPTGEPLITAFARMISSAVREYPILGQVTQFDLGEARVVSLDLDEVAKSGGDAADRQTAVMYMLARYILARNYYLTEDNVEDMPEKYRAYHRNRVSELREDHKRIVFDEFHRTSKAKAVRDQVVIDMREGRKWKVQIALLSQSLDDFDEIMVEFATSIFIMDAGPSQAVARSAKVFGLSETAQVALRTRVHGPREGGATFLAQFATKEGMNTQLLTSTLGPVELWSFSTTVEDATLRNILYQRIGPVEARRVLSTLFPGGSIGRMVEQRLAALKDEKGMIDEEDNLGVVHSIAKEILEAYAKNPKFKRLA